MSLVVICLITQLIPSSLSCRCSSVTSPRTFQVVVTLARGNATAQAMIPQAAADVRHSAGLNASYLVYIGK